VQPLIEIIYMSRSTFTPSRLVMNIEPNVARILAKSRINNRRNGLVGVLYFGDGCFFQCLQGEETTVDALYALLQSDNRHKDLKLFSRKQISALAYADWSMKYVPIEKDMTRLLEKGGYQKFDPYQFDDAMIQGVMSLLQSAADPTTGSKVEKMIQQSIKAPSGAKLKLGWSVVVIIALIVAVGIMIFTQLK
jgi:Sensors of blue-light using FAD